MPKLLEAQYQICAKYQTVTVAPEDMVAVAMSTLGRMPIHGTRIELEEGENISWFIYCGEFSEDPDFYQPIHTTHLANYLPLVLKYLRLPPGANFIIDDRGYEDVWMVETSQE
ncbi:immunity protein Imm33 domain-containing protein [Chitinimonas naiadis]